MQISSVNSVQQSPKHKNSLTKVGFAVGASVSAFRCVSDLKSEKGALRSIIQKTVDKGFTNKQSKAIVALSTALVVGLWGVAGGSVLSGLGAIANAFKNNGKMQ